MLPKAVRSALDLIGNHTAGGTHPSRRRALPPVRQAGKPEPRRLDQGPHRALHDRGGGRERQAEAGGHDCRSHRRQHRPRPRPGRHAERLQAHSRRARQDGAREGAASARARRRCAADALRRRQGPSRLLSGHGRAHRDRGCRAISSTSFPTRQSARHETTTGPEISEQMDGDVDAVVVGVGSGGTLTGLGRFFAKHSPKTQMVLADPSAPFLRRSSTPARRSSPAPGPSKASARTSSPTMLTLKLVKKAYSISDKESVEAARELLSKEASWPARLPARCSPPR